ncbi:hypothetical protein ACA910_007501 [Epithemia clementina (nom. ined.)]
MSSIISPEALAIVKATAPIVKEHAEAITTVFYSNMIGRHPELYRYFNASHHLSHNSNNNVPVSVTTSKLPKQTKSLADAVVAYALNIEHLEHLNEAVIRICHKHCALGVQPAQYTLVHDHLLEAIGEVLGEAVTQDVAAAWSQAILALAKILIQTETQLYEQADWTGPRDFVISEIIDEAKDIKSFRLVPKDGPTIGSFQPGQYISIYERPHDKKYFAPRHYTVTSQPGDAYYQVSIKKLVGHGSHNPDGIMSNFMHSKQVGDIVQLGPVFGPAPLEKGSVDRMACFVSVGIGITPTVAMLPTAMKERPNVAVFHADTSSETFAFDQHLQNLLSPIKNQPEEAANSQQPTKKDENNHKQACTIMNVSYSNPTAKCRQSPFFTEGRLTGHKIMQALTAQQVNYQTDVDYYICAGTVVSPAIYKEFIAAGVSKDCLHLEFFGPFASVVDDEKDEDAITTMTCPFIQQHSAYREGSIMTDA